MQTLHKDVAFIQNDRAWHLLDASKAPLGRLASLAASLLIGKHKSYVSHHLDCGDFVVVTNAEKLVLTGNKAKQKGARILNKSEPTGLYVVAMLLPIRLKAWLA